MRCLTSLLVLCAVGCGAESGEVAPEAHYPVDIWPETPLNLEEIGRLEGDELFRVGTVLIADDGSTVVSQERDNVLRYYSAEGRPRTTAGREGEGPGEFLSMAVVGWIADSTFVYDRRQSRYSVFGPEQSFERVQRIASSPSWAPAGVSVQHVYAGDTVLVAYGNDELVSTRRTYGLMTANGTQLRELARHPEGEHAVAFGEPGDQIRGVAVAPFAPSAAFDVSASGHRLAIARSGERVEGEVLVTVLSPDGDTVFAKAIEPELDEVDPAARDRQLQMTERRWGAEVVADLRANGLPRYYPSFERVLVGRDGSVWLEMRGTEEEKPYRVWSPEGEPVGTLTIPTEHRILEAELGEAWILEEDELDVESIAHYRVR